VANKPGRRRAQESTAREDILRAARELFSQTGFGATSLRAIATKAGVDVALIPYYFNNKRGLLVAALELPIDPTERIRDIAEGPRAELGRRFVTTFVSVWDDDTTGPPLQGFIRSAVTDSSAAQAFGEFAEHEALPTIIEATGLRIDTVRVILSMIFGMVTMRYLIGVPAFTGLSTEELIELYATRLQAVIDTD